VKERHAIGGAIAIACYAIHGADRLWHHDPWDLMWACHVGCLLVGVGAIARMPVAIAAGVLWLSFGVPLWFLDLATGGDFLPTSTFTHVGGLAVGIPILARTGWPRGAWWRASLLLMGLMLLTRLVAAPAGNVNLAFRVWTGWEGTFPSYGPYFALLMTCAALTFLFVEYVIVAALNRIGRGARDPGSGVSSAS
jgi:hypothetical protein